VKKHIHSTKYDSLFFTLARSDSRFFSQKFSFNYGFSSFSRLDTKIGKLSYIASFFLDLYNKFCFLHDYSIIHILRGSQSSLEIVSQQGHTYSSFFCRSILLLQKKDDKNADAASDSNQNPNPNPNPNQNPNPKQDSDLDSSNKKSISKHSSEENDLRSGLLFAYISILRIAIIYIFTTINRIIM
jgi:hypothetical protein